MKFVNLWARRIRGLWLRKLCAPDWMGYCKSCWMPWRWLSFSGVKETESHCTNYSQSAGCCPLCTQCWKSMTPQERLPFYKELWKVWERVDPDLEPELWESIERAVLEGE